MQPLLRNWYLEVFYHACWNARRFGNTPLGLDHALHRKVRYVTPATDSRVQAPGTIGPARDPPIDLSELAYWSYFDLPDFDVKPN